MAYFNYLGFHLLLVSLFACQKVDSNSSHQIIEINPKKAEQHHLSAIFEKLEYIFLETTEAENSLISYSGVKEVFFDGERVIFFEISQNLDRSIKVFDVTGQFKYSLGSLYGPEGFPSARDFLIDKQTGQIEVLEIFKKKIMFFDIETGALKKEVRLNDSYQFFVKFDNGGYAMHSGNLVTERNNDFNIHFAKTDGTIIKSGVSIPPYLKNFELEDNRFATNKNDNSYLCWDLLSRDINRISQKGIEKSFEIHSQYWVPDEMLERFSKGSYMDKMSILNRQDYIPNINRIIEWDSQLFFLYSYDRKLHWNFYDKKTGEIETYRIESINDHTEINDIDAGLNLYVPFGKHKDKFLFILYPSLVESYMDFIKEYKPELLNNGRVPPVYHKVRSGDNPILVLATLKPEFK